MKKKWKIIQIIFSTLLLYIIYTKLDIKESINSFKNVNLFLILLWYLLFIPWIIISNIKWKIFLDYFKININFTLQTYWIWSFFNNFLPSSFWWDWYRFYKINKIFKNKKKENLSSIFLERITWVFVIALINIIGFVFYYKLLFNSKEVFGLSVLVFFLSIWLIFVLLLWSYFYKIIPVKILKDKIRDVSFILKNVPKNLIIISFLLSIFFYIIVLISYLIYIKAIWIEINKIDFFLLFYIISIINIFWLIPISLNWIWVREWLQVLLFSVLLWMKPELILILAIFLRVWWIIMSSIWWLIYIKEELLVNSLKK